MEFIWNIYEHNINHLKPYNNVDRGYRLNVKNAIPCLNKNTVIQNTVSHNYTATLQQVYIELCRGHRWEEEG